MSVSHLVALGVIHILNGQHTPAFPLRLLKLGRCKLRGTRRCLAVHPHKSVLAGVASLSSIFNVRVTAVHGRIVKQPFAQHRPRCSFRLCQSACFSHLTGTPIERYTALRRLEFGAIFIVHGFHADVAQLAEQAPCKR